MAGVLESYLAGREARRVEAENQRANAMQEFVQANGQAIFNGDTNALGQLAQYDPMTALQLKGQVDSQARAAKNDQRGDQEWQMQVEAWAADKTAQEKADAAAQIEGAVKTGLALPDASAWDAYMQQNEPSLVGKFDQRDAIAQQYMSMAEILKRNETPDPLSGIGKIQADIDAGRISPELGQAAIQKEIAKSGMKITSDGQGGFTFEEGAGVTGGVGSALKPGTAPAGYNIFPEPSAPGGVAAAPTPGGPADLEQKALAEKKALEANNRATTADVVTTTIDDLRKTILKPKLDAQGNIVRDAQGNIVSDRGFFDLPEVGVRGAALANMGIASNQEATNVQNQLKTLKGAVAFDTIAKMRAASPTGGALGAISDTEMGLLSAALGSLEQTNDPQVLMKSFDIIESVMKKAAAYPNASEFGLPVAGSGSPTQGTLPAVTGFGDAFSKY